jgi:hypothetical protein
MKINNQKLTLMTDLTGSSASPSIQLGDCYATTSTDYLLTYVESYNISTPPLIALVDLLVDGIAPITIVFVPANNNTGSDTLSLAKATCLTVFATLLHS